jgi:hypothetical protein
VTLIERETYAGVVGVFDAPRAFLYTSGISQELCFVSVLYQYFRPPSAVYSFQGWLASARWTRQYSLPSVYMTRMSSPPQETSCPPASSIASLWSQRCNSRCAHPAFDAPARRQEAGRRGPRRSSRRSVRHAACRTMISPFLILRAGTWRTTTIES